MKFQAVAEKNCEKWATLYAAPSIHRPKCLQQGTIIQQY